MFALLHGQTSPTVFGPSLQIHFRAVADELFVFVPTQLALFQRGVLRLARERHHQAAFFAARLEVDHLGGAFVDFGNVAHDFRYEHLFFDLAQCAIVGVACVSYADEFVVRVKDFTGVVLTLTESVWSSAHVVGQYVRFGAAHIMRWRCD